MREAQSVCAIKIPKLSAANANSEPWRIQRLNEIVGRLNTFSYNRYKYDLLAKLAKLHDENDALQITWNSDPTAAEKTVTAHLWSEVLSTDQALISHQST